MIRFRFPLERVLEWRRLQMRAEEEKLLILQQRADGIVARMSSLASAELRSEWGLRKLASVDGSDLRALASFQDRVRKLRDALETEKQNCEKMMAQQRTRLLRARRDFRVIEKLRERKLEAWQYLSERELEEIAADVHNSKLIRSRLEEAEGAG